MARRFLPLLEQLLGEPDAQRLTADAQAVGQCDSLREADADFERCLGM